MIQSGDMAGPSSPGKTSKIKGMASIPPTGYNRRRMRKSLALAAALAANSCSLPDSEWFGHIPEPDPTHFRLCNSGEPEYIDPALANATNDMKVIYQIHDGLTAWDPGGLPEPSIATHWDVAPDMKTFTFHLRKDARWSDGTPITSTDFVHSLRRVVHPLTASQKADTVKVRYAEEFTAGKVRMVLRDVGPFRAGEAVLNVPPADDKQPSPPNPNLRRAREALKLRDDADPALPPYATVPAGAEVHIVELGGPGCPTRPIQPLACDWAYVFWGAEDGKYGWTPLAALDHPGAEQQIAVMAADEPAATARKATVRAADLLMLPELLGIEAPDPYTLVLRSKDPVPYFIDLTAQSPFRLTSRRAVSREPKRWTRPENIITSGEFHLKAWKPRDKFELVKSPTWWGRDRVKLERLTIYSMNDQSANANVYYQGGCDATVSNNIPNSYFPVLSGENGGQWRKDYLRSAFLGIYFYLINVQRYPNVHFRRALSHALDRRMLPKMLKGGQIPATWLVPSTPFANMTDEELATCGATKDTPGHGLIVEKGKICYRSPRGAEYDLEKARAELALAKKELGGKLPPITIRYNSGVEYHKTMAEWIQHEWSTHLGLTVTTESQEWQTMLKAIRNKDYDIARFGSIGNFPDPEAEFVAPSFRCGAPDNKTGYCNAKFDELLQQAEQLADRKARLDLIRQAEEIMISEQPIIPLYVYTQHALQKPYVKGLPMNISDQHQFRHVWIDPAWKETEGQ